MGKIIEAHHPDNDIVVLPGSSESERTVTGGGVTIVRIADIEIIAGYLDKQILSGGVTAEPCGITLRDVGRGLIGAPGACRGYLDKRGSPDKPSAFL